MLNMDEVTQILLHTYTRHQEWSNAKEIDGCLGVSILMGMLHSNVIHLMCSKYIL